MIEEENKVAGTRGNKLDSKELQLFEATPADKRDKMELSKSSLAYLESERANRLEYLIHSYLIDRATTKASSVSFTIRNQSDVHISLPP